MRVLTSGIDTLVLSVDVRWNNSELFKVLSQMKEKAREEAADRPGIMRGPSREDDWIFSLRPFGTRGYEWILTGKDLTMRIGKFLEPSSRPSMMVEISSEALWRQGPLNICERILRLIEYNGGLLLNVKTSRADLCVDILFESELWNRTLVDNRTTKAKEWIIHENSKGIKQIRFGMEKIFCRIYDKALEIKQKSKKLWMYDIWGIEKVEEDKKVIRIEFQIRRDVLKELGVGKIQDFFKKCDTVWAYCTQNWLKFQDRPGKHHTQRKTIEWWIEVQNGFMGVQSPTPAIREKAIKEDAEQLRSQIVGFVSSLTALKLEEYEFEYDEKVSFKDSVSAVIDYYRSNGKGIEDFVELVKKKRAKYSRTLNPIKKGE
ncbi:hypothetical protein ACFL7M_12355 [Thermodesulfobacteriota bacterium]